MRDIRSEFPALSDEVVYLDSGATSIKPRRVLDAVRDYYENFPANVHRGGYPWANRATELYERARKKVASLINAESEEVIFTKNATEGLNLAAHILDPLVGEGDRIIVSILEHHANFLPWMRLARRKGAEFSIARITAEGYLDLEDLERRMTPNTKVVAITMASNVLGTIPPLREVVKLARRVGAYVVLDGAQYLPHRRVDVKALGAHFISFSGHKAFAPMGTGILWGRAEILRDGSPLLVGGSMIRHVREDGYDLADSPNRYEAGTPNVGGVIGLGEAVDFILEVGYERMAEHEARLTEYLWEALADIPGLERYGPPPKDRTSLVAFNVAGVHPHDVAWYLGEMGIMVRSGGHCAHPLHAHLGIPYGQSVRASLSIFNTTEDVDRLVEGIRKVRKVFGV
ncbi:MAG: cysteine desulfurase [Thermotogae bacterium]|nr:cysteine desulfurase [Thermotogota bacterium]